MSDLRSQGLEVIHIAGIDNARLGVLCKALRHVNTTFMQQWSESNPAPQPYPDDSFGESEFDEHLKAVDKYTDSRLRAANLIPNLISSLLGTADEKGFSYTQELAIFEADTPRLYFKRFTYPDEPTYEPDTIVQAIAFDGFGATVAGKLATRTALDEVVVRSHKIDKVPFTYRTLEPELFEPYLYAPSPKE